MIEIRRILCPIDFSDFSRHAFDHAVAIARWYESTVKLFHVTSLVPVAAFAPGPAMFPPPVLTPADREGLLASMKRFAESEAGATVPIEFEIAEGNAAAQIVARAKTIPSDLLVMGTHGRSGFERLVLGSVTEKVLRKAACPVLSVPRAIADAVPTALFKRILCAVDFSDCSIQALNYATSLAQEADDRRERLKHVFPESVRAHGAVESVVATGKPYREILRVASEKERDLIVIGIQGRGATDMLFFGSTAQHVVRQASCPVLTLRGVAAHRESASVRS